MERSQQDEPHGGYNRIVTHDDFDGVVSAALCSLAEGIEDFRFAGPGSLHDPGLEITEQTILCDLPHHPSTGLWFDHHVGNLEDFKLKGGNPDELRGAFAPEKSCARVVYQYYSGTVAFPEHMPPAVREADILDSFDYRDIDDWQQETPAKTIGDTLRVSFRNRRERNRYLRHLIRRVRAVPLEEILTDSEVKERAVQFRELAEKNRVLIEKLAAFLPEDAGGEIVLLDTTGLKHMPLLIKSLAFLSFPRARAVLEIKCLFRQGRKTNDLAFSLSLSPAVEVGSLDKDVGEIMRTMNIGDGHRGAGAGRIGCRSKADMLKQKEDLVRQIFTHWRSQGSSGASAASGHRG